jgi:hypothetical protein
LENTEEASLGLARRLLERRKIKLAGLLVFIEHQSVLEAATGRRAACARQPPRVGLT